MKQQWRFAVDISDLTIVVPTKNEEANIQGFLASLPRHLQLIVVDASQDATPTLIQRIRPHNTTLIRHPGNVTHARQIGAVYAQTEWLLFTDADIRFPPDYFHRLVLYDNVDAVYGPKLSRDRFSAYYRRFSWGQGLLHRLGIPAASGSNMLLRRRAFGEIGGFDLQLNCNEDTELMWRVRRHGFTVTYAPNLPVYASDHRRLERGRLRKTAHTLARGLLLYTNLLPSRWRISDWGYWTAPEKGT
jgi:glycosyltransferase involved in cell wall biosynthesis